MSRAKLNRLFNDADMPKSGRMCVYSLYSDDVCIYVGQTSDFEKRIYNHLSTGKVFDSFDFIYCTTDRANEIEAEQIVKMQPRINKELPPSDEYVLLNNIHTTIFDRIHVEVGNLNLAFSGHTTSKNPKLIKRYITKDVASKVIDGVINQLKAEVK